MPQPRSARMAQTQDVLTRFVRQDLEVAGSRAKATPSQTLIQDSRSTALKHLLRRILRSVAERKWSALVRRGCLLCTCCTAGDRGGVRCQTSWHGSAMVQRAIRMSRVGVGVAEVHQTNIASQALFQGRGSMTVRSSDWVVCSVPSEMQHSSAHEGVSGEEGTVPSPSYC